MYRYYSEEYQNLDIAGIVLVLESFVSRYVSRTAVGFCTRVTYIRGTTGS